MAKKQIILKESSLKRIIAESVKKILKEGESGGWVVDSSEAQTAYDFFVQEMGSEEYANEAIVRAMGDVALSDILAYLFRQYELKGWEEYRKDNSNPTGYEY